MGSRNRYAVLAVALFAVIGLYLWRQDTTAPPKPRKPAVRHATGLPKKAARPAAPKPAPVPQPPKPLAHPPEVVRAVYFTSWSAGLRSRVDYLANLRRTTQLNAVVFDIKDYSGYVDYRVAVPEAKEYRSIRVTIRDIDALISRLHREGIYVIARITVFQDPILARARPDLAVHRTSELPAGPHHKLTASTLWLDRKGLAWIDPASRPAWDYIVAIARDAVSHGVDEVNFDYVRFPSDGNLKDMYFPSWDGKTPKHVVIGRFFAYLRQHLAGVPVSADLFGLSTVNEDDLGIGQVIEDAYKGFDYVCPMVYPSHYARQFLGYPNPAAHPYDVVNYSMRSAHERLEEFLQPRPAPVTAADGDGRPEPAAHPSKRQVKLRPWLQDFNLGAHYDAAMVKAEIQAVRDALGNKFAGYMLWSPSNIYTREALQDTPPIRAAADSPSQRRNE